MFSKLFEQRDKTITHLVKLGDCIARSLRENVSLFAIDSNNSEVSYLTEGGKVISGNFKIDKDVSINHIDVQDSSIFEDSEKLDVFVNKKIHSFVEGIHYGEYTTADDSFSDILSLWENRCKLSSVQAKLHEQSTRLQNIEEIIESAEFKKLVEVSPQLQDFLKENFKSIISVPEIRNAINLSNAVAKAFNFPKLTLEEMQENKTYTLKDGITPSIYEMICRQELVKRELLESKKSFDTIWATNASIKNLSEMIFKDDKEIVEALSEALKEVPYLALATKKNLFNTFSNCLAQVDGIGVSDKDIQAYASRIFEYKKEVKEVFIQAINEKYGVNIQNIQTPASFKSLANTQVVIFEALSRLSPKGSVLKEILSEMAQSLKTKCGVECIDVNDFLLEVFVKVGYDEILEAGGGTKSKVNFRRVSKDVTDIQDLVKTLQDKVLQDEEYGSDENLDQATIAAGEEQDAGAPSPDPKGKGPSVAAEAVPPDEEAEAEINPETEEDPEVPDQKEQDDVVNDLSDLENMVADIASELGFEDDEEKEDK